MNAYEKFRPEFFRRIYGRRGYNSSFRFPDSISNSSGAKFLSLAERHNAIPHSVDLSDGEGVVSFEFFADRAHYIYIPGECVCISAACRLIYGQKASALCIGSRHVFYFAGARIAFNGKQLSDCIAFRRSYRDWIGGIPPRSFARGAHGIRGQARDGAIAFSGGGNAGSSLGPLLAALILLPYGRFQVIWFSLVALLAIVILSWVGGWYKQNLTTVVKKATGAVKQETTLSKSKVVVSIGILLLLIFSKYIYMASISSYFTFYLIDKFGVSIQSSQIYLFAFLFAVAAGTFIGGPVGDRIGRKYVIWISILGAAPFALLLPYVDLFWTGVLSCIIGLILSSAFSAILVYAQELIPGKVGMIAGLFFGFAFGIAGIGSAILGTVADKTSIEYVFWICSFLPLIGLLTGFLPNLEKKH